MDKRTKTRWRRNRRPERVIITISDLLPHDGDLELDWRDVKHFRVRVDPSAVLYARRYV